MIEFIKLMGLNRVLFLVGLVLYIVIIFIVLCTDPPSQNHTIPEDDDENTYEDENEEDDMEDPLSPEDALYTVQASLSEPKSPGILRKIFRKKPKNDDFWYL